jgi:hypothetical protein
MNLCWSMKRVGSRKIYESLLEFGKSRFQEDIGIPAGIWNEEATRRK